MLIEQSTIARTLRHKQRVSNTSAPGAARDAKMLKLCPATGMLRKMQSIFPTIAKGFFIALTPTLGKGAAVALGPGEGTDIGRGLDDTGLNHVNLGGLGKCLRMRAC
jgi:hypothetical protein